ncbi:hypothetical protein [Schlesneria paludicola]|uniref:hypothetical protein n=1 Tax=Schlesneria paludicola TaxID=360056 RepID=UPI00029A0711|nr:hypothetical protein [Schlesneria paludicola]
MNFDELQAEWQSHNHQGQIKLNPQLLLNEVRRNQRYLESVLFRRDLREVSVAVFLAILFSVDASRMHEWAMYPLAASCLGVGVFFIVDRQLQKRKRPAKNDTLEACIHSSLHQVNHQIWLLTNILWWYVLPIVFGAAPLFLVVCWRLRDAGWLMYVVIGLIAAIAVLVAAWVYSVNQRCVQSEFQPRRRELEDLLASLTAVPHENVGDDPPATQRPA